uniref:PH domain-containing protein n=1 Tax=Denticeps clupeoides TaxID=299321 RepID=A0AAY4E3C6_9TELE
ALACSEGRGAAPTSAAVMQNSFLSGPRTAIRLSALGTFGKREQAIKRNPNMPVVVRGWLYKQDSSGMRLWKRKWFVLSDYCLFYYKDSREETVLGSIPLPSYVITPVDPDDHISRKYAFKVGPSESAMLLSQRFYIALCLHILLAGPFMVRDEHFFHVPSLYISNCDGKILYVPSHVKSEFSLHV